MTTPWIVTLIGTTLTFLLRLAAYKGCERISLLCFFLAVCVRTAAAFWILLDSADLTAVLIFLLISFLPDCTVELFRLKKHRTGTGEDVP